MDNKAMDADGTASSDREFVGLAPADYADPVVEVFKKDVDRTLLRANLELSPEERLEQLARFVAAALELQQAPRSGVSPPG